MGDWDTAGDENSPPDFSYLIGYATLDQSPLTFRQPSRPSSNLKPTILPHFPPHGNRLGKNFPRAPHHRASSCPNFQTNSTCRCSADPNFYTLYGALVGGPNMDDTYNDACPDFQKNEVRSHRGLEHKRFHAPRRA